MKLTVAAIQMRAELGQIQANRERVEAHLEVARRAGACLAVLPEMVLSGYGLVPDFAPLAEECAGPSLARLQRLSRHWKLAIALGFVERAGHHLYDALAVCLPDGRVHVYRKRQLVFWEGFCFRRGRTPLIVPTPWGRIGLAICADMIDRSVWESYRGRIDVALISAAWPEFAHRDTGRRHWLLGRLGPLASSIPAQVAADLEIPVVFANQCGPTCSTIPYLGTWLAERIPDRFAGNSCVCDGLDGPTTRAATEERVLLAEVTVPGQKGAVSWFSMCPSASAA